MTQFISRYKKLNAAQKQAVDAIDGPLLVIAGPGTGKTELLSMRAANILQKTDTLPENILCLTFTDSGVAAMRQRLASIIGPTAYKIAVHTFHSFGSEIINQHAEYFYHGASFKPADELSTYEILHGIFDELDHGNPLAVQLNGEYTYLKDTAKTISELKQAGISHDELLRILAADEEVLDLVESDLTNIFMSRISVSMMTLLAPIAQKVATIPRPDLPPAITPLSNVLALSMAHAFDVAVTSGKTTAITKWRNEWLEKDRSGNFVFKDRKRIARLRALSHVYFSYLSRMEQAGLYDYDDMILRVVHVLESQSELLFNLREQYHYIMVDEFQDTNLAQLRIVFDLMEPSAHDTQPNIMAVGDDDQAIYSFQGADVNNIHRFRERYESHRLITLVDNYRSDTSILSAARDIITQGDNRLESTIDSLDKTLVPHHKGDHPDVGVFEHPNPKDERAWVARRIKEHIDAGVDPASIAVIARKHDELVRLLPFLEMLNIPVRYERSDNILELESFRAVELLATIIHALHINDHSLVNSLMPELLAHPAFSYPPEDIWRLSLRSYRNKSLWLEQMVTSEVFTPLGFWLIEQSKNSAHQPLEPMLDLILGIPREVIEPESSLYRPPIYDYYFGDGIREHNAERYLIHLRALRTVRSAMQQYQPNRRHRLTDFVEFVALHRDMNAPLIAIQSASETDITAINLMTAHKAKGLEFPIVYIIGAVDSVWGERVRVRSRLIGYPANLRISPTGDTPDERLRLFFVAMTRARDQLFVSYSLTGDNGKPLLPASFLSGMTHSPQKITIQQDDSSLIENSQIDWLGHIINVKQRTMKELLSPLLENYRLSSTHLSNFLDVTRGGPTLFLINNLLHFPASKAPSASYGTAIHHALQRSHAHFAATGKKRPLEDTLGDFSSELRAQDLTELEFEAFNRRGISSLTKFLSAREDTFSQTQRTELSFANQNVMIGDARLTGSLDLVDIRDTSIIVTDYKTGAPSYSWAGKSDYEKTKLHRYKQQLMFYQLLVENSRNYSKYAFEKGILQFVEPDPAGELHQLDASFTNDELEHFRLLIGAVWQAIMTLDFPDTSEYDASYKGILAFEQNIVDKYSL